MLLALAEYQRHEQNQSHTKTSSSQNGDLIKRIRKQCAPGVLFFSPPPEHLGTRLIDREAASQLTSSSSSKSLPCKITRLHGKRFCLPSDRGDTPSCSEYQSPHSVCRRLCKFAVDDDRRIAKCTWLSNEALDSAMPG